MTDLKKLSDIDPETLPVKEFDFFTLYNSAQRGVKSIIKPWELMKELNFPTEKNALQNVYDQKVKELTEGIMTIIVNEHYSK